MGMSTHVVAFRPPDEQWKKMKAVWDACDAAGVQPPAEVEAFFNDEVPDDRGVEVKLEAPCLQPLQHPYISGFEVHLDHLPSGVKIIRFYNAW